MSFVAASDFGTASGNMVTWSNLANINPGEVKILTVDLKVDDASFATYRNLAEISEDSSEDYGVDIPDDEDDHDFEDLSVQVVYDLALVKTISNGQPTEIAVGDQVTYDITITNQGNVPSLGFEVGETIPEGMSFVSASDEIRRCFFR